LDLQAGGLNAVLVKTMNAQPRRSLHLSHINHQTGQRLELEMLDLPFPSRSYQIRVNGQWAKKHPWRVNRGDAATTALVGGALTNARCLCKRKRIDPAAAGPIRSRN
jgi:hypothetical protein